MNHPTGLIAPGQFDNNDNLLFPTSASLSILFDTKGFSFTAHMTDTNFDVDIASDGAGGYVGYFVDSDTVQFSFPVNISVAPVELSHPALPFWEREYLD